MLPSYHYLEKRKSFLSFLNGVLPLLTLDFSPRWLKRHCERLKFDLFMKKPPKASYPSLAIDYVVDQEDEMLIADGLKKATLCKQRNVHYLRIRPQLTIGLELAQFEKSLDILNPIRIIYRFHLIKVIFKQLEHQNVKHMSFGDSGIHTYSISDLVIGEGLKSSDEDFVGHPLFYLSQKRLVIDVEAATSRFVRLGMKDYNYLIIDNNFLFSLLIIDIYMMGQKRLSIPLVKSEKLS